MQPYPDSKSFAFHTLQVIVASFRCKNINFVFPPLFRCKKWASEDIRWSTGRTRPFLSSWALYWQRSRSHVGGRFSWSLGRWSTCPVGWNVVLRTEITRASSFWGVTDWLIGIWPRICSEVVWERYSKIDRSCPPSSNDTSLLTWRWGTRAWKKTSIICIYIVVSFQPVMGWMGGDCVPSTKHLCQMPFMLKRPSFPLWCLSWESATP